MPSYLRNPASYRFVLDFSVASGSGESWFGRATAPRAKAPIGSTRTTIGGCLAPDAFRAATRRLLARWDAIDQQLAEIEDPFAPSSVPVADSRNADYPLSQCRHRRNPDRGDRRYWQLRVAAPGTQAGGSWLGAPPKWSERRWASPKTKRGRPANRREPHQPNIRFLVRLREEHRLPAASALAESSLGREIVLFIP